MTVDAFSSVCNLGILDSLTEGSINEIVGSWNGFCVITGALLKGNDESSVGSEFESHVHALCKHGLQSLVEEHFLRSIQEIFEKNGAAKFWRHFDSYKNVAAFGTSDKYIQEAEIQKVLYKALEEISLVKQYLEKCLSMLVHALQLYKDSKQEGRNTSDVKGVHLFSKYQLIVSSILMTTLPRHFPEVLHWYFKGRLEELSTIMAGECEDDNESEDKDDMDLDEKNKSPNRTGYMDIDGCNEQRSCFENNKLVKNIGIIVHDLRNLGFTSMTEDAYASAIFLLLKAKVHHLAGDDYRSSVLDSIKGCASPVFACTPYFSR